MYSCFDVICVVGMRCGVREDDLIRSLACGFGPSQIAIQGPIVTSVLVFGPNFLFFFSLAPLFSIFPDKAYVFWITFI